jgi:hypothetical protein
MPATKAKATEHIQADDKAELRAVQIKLVELQAHVIETSRKVAIKFDFFRFKKPI